MDRAIIGGSRHQMKYFRVANTQNDAVGRALS